MTAKKLEWTGSITALLGAFMVATHATWADYGFIAYLVSNIFFIGYAMKEKAFGILTMQVGFTMISLYGISNSQF